MTTMKMKDLRIGVRVFDCEGHNIFRVAAQSHPGYEGCTTLLSEKITGVACFDAAEPDTPGKNIYSLVSEYGSNNYAKSNIHQWLNSDEADWYKPTHPTDTPPVAEYTRYGEQPYADHPGYLTRFSQTFKDALVERDIPVLERKGKQKAELTYVKAKVFLPSRTEMNKGDECGIAEGKPLPIFYDLSLFRAIPTDEDLEKFGGRGWNPPQVPGVVDVPHVYDVKHGWWYWMRTPSYLYSYLQRAMFTYGAVGYTYANNDVVGVRPLFNVDGELEVLQDEGPVYQYTIIKK